jgi:hypothetical protein
MRWVVAKLPHWSRRGAEKGRENCAEMILFGLLLLRVVVDAVVGLEHVFDVSLEQQNIWR